MLTSSETVSLQSNKPAAKAAEQYHVADCFEQLLGRIKDKTARVGIIGLGYVGLPLARAFSAKGLAVLGFDIDPNKVTSLWEAKSYLGHISDAVIREMLDNGFEATANFERLEEPD